MNWDTIKGNWKQFTGSIKKTWGRLTDDELMEIAGDRDRLVGKIQEKYGYAKDEAHRRLSEWERAQEPGATRSGTIKGSYDGD
jgi:uncharacterized protein YjbJ (UPF0337 family)